MRTTTHRVQGDVRDWVDIDVDGVESVDDVVAIEGHVWSRGLRYNLAASMTDSNLKRFRVELGPTPAHPWLPNVEMRHKEDEWFLELELTWADGTVLTFPSGRPLTIVVRRQGE